MLRFLRKRSPEDRFWNWFILNSRRLFQFEASRELIFDELSLELKKIHESLCFEFGPIQDGRREFIISADGDKAAFPVVQKLARSAPSFSEWIVIPFRPPKNIDHYPEVVYGQVTLSVDDIWFTYESETSVTHLELYIRGHTPENDGNVGAAAFLLLDSALGEYVVETRIGAITRNALPDDPEAAGLIPFRDLPQIVNLPTH